jgi:hypothetical protein
MKYIMLLSELSIAVARPRHNGCRFYMEIAWEIQLTPVTNDEEDRGGYMVNQGIDLLKAGQPQAALDLF